MSFDDKATSRYGAIPFELYWFSMAPPVGSGGQDWRVTSGDIQRTYLTHAYAPLQVDRSEISQDQELTEGGIDVTIPSSHELAQQFLRGTPISPISLTIYAGHDGDSEVVVAFSGKVTTANFKGQECRLMVSPDHQAVRKMIPSVAYQHPCNHVVYSSQCGLPVAGFGGTSNKVRWDLTIASVNGRTITVSGGSDWTTAFTPFPSDDTNVPTCAWGFLTLPSGRAIMIEAHNSINTFVLTEHDDELVVGLAIKANRGCRRTLTHCKFLFKDSGQSPRWLGFDSVPSANPFRGLY
jgi:hypothetical protein